MQAHKRVGQSVGADALVALGGFAPPTLHALGARAASGFSRGLFNLVVTQRAGAAVPAVRGGGADARAVPGGAARRGQALASGLTSYDGGVYYGLNADRDAMPDVDVLAGMVDESLDELLETVS